MNFKDFDKNNLGTLTISQVNFFLIKQYKMNEWIFFINFYFGFKFKRSLTEPNLAEPDLNLIIKKYQHPDKPEVVNYLNFYHDLKLSMKSQNEEDLPFIVPNSSMNPNYRPVFFNFIV